MTNDPTEGSPDTVKPPDPDRFFDRTTPGAHEWWYFDAISDDGRDAIVAVWYAGLPFDPEYGVATLRHLRNPAKHHQPRALDHSAIGFSWYRDGKLVVYALNGYRADRFCHRADPFAVEVASSRVERDGTGYRLTVAMPTVDGQPISAEFRFHPADATEPFERNLGTPEAPHDWILAAADCRVEGTASVGSETRTFAGRGYHDHNAGAEDLTVAMRRWEWGRVHSGPRTDVYYRSEPHRGDTRSLWITCRDGRPVEVRERVTVATEGPQRNVFRVAHADMLRLSEGEETLTRRNASLVDDGPFYLRWLAEFDVEETSGVKGFAELLDTRNLHSRWFNWMIPYRLKRPRA